MPTGNPGSVHQQSPIDRGKNMHHLTCKKVFLSFSDMYAHLNQAMKERAHVSMFLVSDHLARSVDIFDCHNQRDDTAF